MRDPSPAPGGAQLSVRIGTAVDFEARISAAALLATGALVSGIVLASAVIVRAARRRSTTVLRLHENAVGDDREDVIRSGG